MSRPATIETRIDTVIRVEIEHISQAEASRHQSVEEVAAGLAPSPDQTGFDLEQARLGTELAELSTRTSVELKILSAEYEEASRESELFLDEHGLPRRPPYQASLLPLVRSIALAMTGEAAATAAIYKPAIGWAPAIMVAGLISLAVAVPAMLLAMGLVLSRHRLSRTYWLIGLGSIAVALALLLLMMLCSAHFRQLTAAMPALMSDPMAMLEILIASLRSAPFRPLADPANAGLFAAAALAAGFVAWETFRTFGYLGWRSVAGREEEARNAILRESTASLGEAAAAKGRQERAIDLKVARAKDCQRALRRTLGLDTDVVRSTTTALAELATERAGAQAIVTRALRRVARRLAAGREAPACPTFAVDRVDLETDRRTL